MMQHDGVGTLLPDTVSFECDEDAEECWEAPYPGEGVGRHTIYPSIHLGANWGNSSDKLQSVGVPDVSRLAHTRPLSPASMACRRFTQRAPHLAG